MHEEVGNACKILLESLRGSARLEDLGVLGEDNIKMVLTEVWMNAVDWIHLAQEWDQWQAVVDAVMKIRVS
jgi:hypothetical protein